MADRSISVDLTANVSGFVSAFKTAQQAAKDFGSRTDDFIKNNGQQMEKVGATAGIMGGAIVAGVGLAVKAWADFDQRMAQVKTLSGATSDQMGDLAKAALTMGENIGLSANDVADAETELVKAGVSVKDIMGGALTGALNLAAAGQIDVGQATEIATVALTQFKLAGKDIPHVADLLAAGADKALGGVDELGMALKQGGLVASSFGLTIDDTVGTMAAFANAGLLGSDAGTSFKTMLLSLAHPSKQSQAAMDELGISAYDAQGKFVGITGLAGQLHDKLGSLTDAQRNATLATVFGTDAIRAANVLYKEGADGIQKWITDVNDTGFAAKQAAGKLDSLSGDFKKLQAAFTNGMIEMGSTADGFLRPVVQGATDAIHAFNGLPENVKGVGLAAAASVGGFALLAGAFLTVIPKIHDTVTAFQALRTNSGTTATALGKIGKAAAGIGLAVVAIDLLGHALTQKAAVKSADELADAVIKLGKSGSKVDTSGLDALFSSFDKVAGSKTSDITDMAGAIDRITHPQGGDGINRWADSVFGWTGWAKSETSQVDDKLKSLGDTMGNLASSGDTADAAAAFSALSDQFIKNGSTAQDALDHLPGYKDALLEIGHATGVSLEGQDLLDLAVGKVPAIMADAKSATEKAGTAQQVAAQQTEAMQKALDDMGISAEGAVTDIDKFTQSLVNAGLLTMSARDAEGKYQQSITDVADAVKNINEKLGGLGVALNKNKSDFDLTTAAGRAANGAFEGVAQAGIASAEAMAKNGASQKDVQGKLAGTYDSLIKAAGQFGITGGKADALARAVLGVPKGVSIKTWMATTARAEAERLKGATDALNGKRIDIYAYTHDITLKSTLADPTGTGSSVGGRKNGSLRGGLATGGPVEGPGAKGVDGLLYMLAPGEHVLSDSDVDAMGGQAAVSAFRKQLHAGTVQKSAPSINLAAASAAPAGDIYVQNPFTGEYLLAHVARVADNSAVRAIGLADRDSDRRRIG